MSNITNLYSLLLSIFLNQSMTSFVFFHWFTCKTFFKLILILSKTCLLIFPTSFFAGFIRQTVGLLSKLSLWSYNVMKQLLSEFISILFKICLSYFSITLLPSTFILFLILLLVFLYVVVIESFFILLY